MRKNCEHKDSSKHKNMSRGNGEVTNPFEESDRLEFTLLYKGRRHLFVVPILYDKSFLVNDIKKRTGVKRTFSIQVTEKQQQKKTSNKKVQTAKQEEVSDDNNKSLKKSLKKKSSETCIHSTNLTTLALSPYHGETLLLIDNEAVMASDDPRWLIDPLKRDPVPAHTRKFIKQKFDPFDCPP